MIRDLLREILGEAWVNLLDLASAERVPTSFTSRRHQKRESDFIWRFRRKDNGEPVYVYILLEFQSRPDRYMAVRAGRPDREAGSVGRKVCATAALSPGP
jgi:hypothetical protein